MAVSKETLTDEELAALERARAEAAEKERLAGDYIVHLEAQHDKLFALTKLGRIFARMTDPRPSNDGRGGERFTWRQVEGPF
jgi:hypothetical protein